MTYVQNNAVYCKLPLPNANFHTFNIIGLYISMIFHTFALESKHSVI